MKIFPRQIKMEQGVERYELIIDNSTPSPSPSPVSSGDTGKVLLFRIRRSAEQKLLTFSPKKGFVLAGERKAVSVFVLSERFSRAKLLVRVVAVARDQVEQDFDACWAKGVQSSGGEVRKVIELLNPCYQGTPEGVQQTDTISEVSCASWFPASTSSAVHEESRSFHSLGGAMQQGIMTNTSSEVQQQQQRMEQQLQLDLLVSRHSALTEVGPLRYLLEVFGDYDPEDPHTHSTPYGTPHNTPAHALDHRAVLAVLRERQAQALAAGGRVHALDLRDIPCTSSGALLSDILDGTAEEVQDPVARQLHLLRGALLVDHLTTLSISHCTLHSLGGGAVEQLSRFRGLTALYLTNARLRSLGGAVELPLLKVLDLQGNLLVTLDGVQGLLSLVSLSAAHNRLSSLQVLTSLLPLQRLRVLDLRGNPLLTAHASYADEALLASPRLQELDGLDLRSLLPSYARGGGVGGVGCVGEGEKRVRRALQGKAVQKARDKANKEMIEGMQEVSSIHSQGVIEEEEDEGSYGGYQGEQEVKQTHAQSQSQQGYGHGYGYGSSSRQQPQQVQPHLSYSYPSQSQPSTPSSIGNSSSRPTSPHHTHSHSNSHSHSSYPMNHQPAPAVRAVSPSSSSHHGPAPPRPSTSPTPSTHSSAPRYLTASTSASKQRRKSQAVSLVAHWAQHSHEASGVGDRSKSPTPVPVPGTPRRRTSVMDSSTDSQRIRLAAYGKSLDSSAGYSTMSVRGKAEADLRAAHHREMQEDPRYSIWHPRYRTPVQTFGFSKPFLRNNNTRTLSNPPPNPPLYDFTVSRIRDGFTRLPTRGTFTRASKGLTAAWYPMDWADLEAVRRQGYFHETIGDIQRSSYKDTRNRDPSHSASTTSMVNGNGSVVLSPSKPGRRSSIGQHMSRQYGSSSGGRMSVSFSEDVLQHERFLGGANEEEDQHQSLLSLPQPQQAQQQQHQQAHHQQQQQHQQEAAPARGPVRSSMAALFPSVEAAAELDAEDTQQQQRRPAAGESAGFGEGAEDDYSELFSQLPASPSPIPHQQHAEGEEDMESYLAWLESQYAAPSAAAAGRVMAQGEDEGFGEQRRYSGRGSQQQQQELDRDSNSGGRRSSF